MGSSSSSLRLFSSSGVGVGLGFGLPIIGDNTNPPRSFCYYFIFYILTEEERKTEKARE
ncbi:hypothetical protein glysoja_016674 [Glycine soja]|nr:hypothetical protein glysoja_016674 [Glycine soja]